MTDKEIRTAIAEACGWKFCPSKDNPLTGNAEPDVWVDPFGNKFWYDMPTHLPDYLNDLNAMHEAAMCLRENHPLKYVHYTAAITALVAKFNSDLENRYSISAHDATARQRADAFVQIIEKWKDETK